MTKPGPDSGIVQARLREISLLLADLERLGDIGADRLRDDRFARHVAERVLSQVVELATSINTHLSSTVLDRAPATYRASFRTAVEVGAIDRSLAEELEPSAGIRNILVHGYLEVDLDEVAAAIPLAREQYAAYVRQVAVWLASSSS